MKIGVLTNETEVTTKTDGKIKLKISSVANNGLKIENGKLVGVKGKAGKNGTGTIQNKVGNGTGIGTGTMPIVCMNSSVSRHKKYTKTSSESYDFLHENEGVVMTSPNGAMTENGSVAYFMFKKKTSFG